MSEAGCRGVGAGDVDEDPAPDAVFVVGGCVFVDCYLFGGAGVDEFCGVLARAMMDGLVCGSINIPAATLGNFFNAAFLKSSMHKTLSSGFFAGMGTGMPAMIANG